LLKLTLIASILISALAAAAPAQAAFAEDYMAACLAQTRQNVELCTCKTEQAQSLASEEMLGYIVIAMQDGQKFRSMVVAGEVPDEVVKAWGPYVMTSNRICMPGN
jgi:redox-sensitive bicupin YhaK (pirin superfamily)